MTVLAYHEPSIETILVQSSLLVSSNTVRYLLDRLLACGIVGQILVGILFGEPANLHLLTPEFQRTVMSLGYLGLILLCFQGGARSPLPDLWTTKRLALAVAITGILLPIALSFLLIPLINASLPLGEPRMTLLQAFAAGAALSVTSLGTSFSIISAAHLQHEKVGIVLSSAAMMDDVVGLVLIAIIESLGPSGDGEHQQQKSIGHAVVRPIAASAGSAVVLAILLWALERSLPLVRRLTATNQCLNSIFAFWRRHGPVSSLALQLLTLSAAVSAGAYAGTSPLFVAFLAGVLVAWSSQHASKSTSTSRRRDHEQTSHERYLQQVQEYILLPFFFASIGFVIPIRAMFSPRVVYKGLLYTLLMALAKLSTGVWLLRSRESFTSARKARTNTARARPPLDTTRTKAALLLGTAMMARGEVAFLIASLAQSAGIFTNGEVYMVIVWAAMLCTVFGPVGTGVMVKMMVVDSSVAEHEHENEDQDRGWDGVVLSEEVEPLISD